MPITGQTPLTTINVAKELEQTFQPILFAEISLVDGSVLRLADENFVITDGGPQFLGFDWLPRLKAQNLAAIQSLSDNGIVQSPRLDLTIADADKFILTNWEIPDGMGLKGAVLRVLFALWDADTDNFSQDYAVKFIGICDPPNWDDETMTVSANNRLNLSRVMLPSTAISRLCPWAGFFPTNHAERRLAATNFDAPQYLCGYSPDIVDIGAAGNTGTPGQTFPDGRAITDSVGFFVYCGGSWDECLDRMGNRSLPTTSGPGVGYNGPVQIERDNANHLTGRFGGIHFDPPLAWRGIAYTSGTKQSGLDNPNLPTHLRHGLREPAGHERSWKSELDQARGRALCGRGLGWFGHSAGSDSGRSRQRLRCSFPPAIERPDHLGLELDQYRIPAWFSQSRSRV